MNIKYVILDRKSTFYRGLRMPYDPDYLGPQWYAFDINTAKMYSSYGYLNAFKVKRNKKIKLLRLDSTENIKILNALIESKKILVRDARHHPTRQETIDNLEKLKSYLNYAFEVVEGMITIDRKSHMEFDAFIVNYLICEPAFGNEFGDFDGYYCNITLSTSHRGGTFHDEICLCEKSRDKLDIVRQNQLSASSKFRDYCSGNR